MLYGIVYDKDDPELNNTTIRWQSSIDGLIGANENFSIDASSLSEGLHEIDFVVLDNSGDEFKESVKVFIKRIAPPPPVLDSDGDGIPDDIDSCPFLFGQAGDECNDGNDETVDDIITAGCVCVGVEPIPTLGQWGLIILGLLLAIFGVIANKQKWMSYKHLSNCGD